MMLLMLFNSAYSTIVDYASATIMPIILLMLMLMLIMLLTVDVGVDVDCDAIASELVLYELVLSHIRALAYSRLLKQAIRQTEIHNATEPVRSVDGVVDYTMIDRNFNYLWVPKDMLTLNNRLLQSEENTAIEVNTFMDGLDTMGRFRYMNKVKARLATPF